MGRAPRYTVAQIAALPDDHRAALCLQLITHKFKDEKADWYPKTRGAFIKKRPGGPIEEPATDKKVASKCERFERKSKQARLRLKRDGTPGAPRSNTRHYIYNDNGELEVSFVQKNHCEQYKKMLTDEWVKLGKIGSIPSDFYGMVFHDVFIPVFYKLYNVTPAQCEHPPRRS